MPSRNLSQLEELNRKTMRSPSLAARAQAFNGDADNLRELRERTGEDSESSRQGVEDAEGLGLEQQTRLAKRFADALAKWREFTRACVESDNNPDARRDPNRFRQDALEKKTQEALVALLLYFFTLFELLFKNHQAAAGEKFQLAAAEMLHHGEFVFETLGLREEALRQSPRTATMDRGIFAVLVAYTELINESLQEYQAGNIRIRPGDQTEDRGGADLVLERLDANNKWVVAELVQVKGEYRLADGNLRTQSRTFKLPDDSAALSRHLSEKGGAFYAVEMAKTVAALKALGLQHKAKCRWMTVPSALSSVANEYSPEITIVKDAIAKLADNVRFALGDIQELWALLGIPAWSQHAYLRRVVQSPYEAGSRQRSKHPIATHDDYAYWRQTLISHGFLTANNQEIPFIHHPKNYHLKKLQALLTEIFQSPEQGVSTAKASIKDRWATVSKGMMQGLGNCDALDHVYTAKNVVYCGWHDAKLRENLATLLSGYNPTVYDALRLDDATDSPIASLPSTPELPHREDQQTADLIIADRFLFGWVDKMIALHPVGNDEKRRLRDKLFSNHVQLMFEALVTQLAPNGKLLILEEGFPISQLPGIQFEPIDSKTMASERRTDTGDPSAQYDAYEVWTKELKKDGVNLRYERMTSTTGQPYVVIERV